MIRISMSLPKKMLNDFDEVLHDRGYSSRSKGIRDALKDYIVRYQWMKDIEGERIGVITVIYEHHATGVLEDLTDVQHHFHKNVNATMHIHMTKDTCLEVIVVHGEALDIRELTERIMRLKGVEHVKLTTAATS